jgi:acetyltransferase-like isoleucine patch superfamily enzyme
VAFPREEVDLAEPDGPFSTDEAVVVGYEYDGGVDAPRIGSGSLIRSGTIIYDDVTLGAECRTGHRVTIREETRVGDDVVIGTNVVIDGHVTIGDRASLQTGVYVPPGTTIGDDVFVGPYAVFTNDPYPLRVETELDGPTLEAHVSVGANATVLPGVTIGRESFVAAGAVVTDDVPPATLAVGNPATHRPLPDSLAGGNVHR